VDCKYEQETMCARSERTLVTASVTTPGAPEMTAAQTSELLAQRRSLNSPTKPVLLSASTTKVKVDLRDDGEMKTLNALALGARRGPPTRTHLILSGITFAAPPGVVFYVYLENGADPKRREYPGTLNFFSTNPGVGVHDGHKHGGAVDSARGLTRDFDVTEALRKLGVDKPELNTVTVSFEATTGRVGSAAVPEVNTEARLTVNAIDFRVSAAQ
jgi:hypothetical protein